MKKILLVMFLGIVVMAYAFAAGQEEEQNGEGYPTKSIQFVVGFPAGGGTDTTARSVVPIMEEELGKSIVVTNVAGAAGAIAAEHVLEADNDGYTLFFASETSANWPLNSTSDHWYKDFEVIGLCTNSVATVTVPASSRFKTLDEFIDYAKNNPGELKQAGTGPATTGTIAAAILRQGLGTELNEITYEGSHPAVVSILGGHTDVIMENYFSVSDHCKSGDMRLLGVFANERIPNAPDVPAIGEEYPELQKYLPYGAWFGLYAPKGTPENVLKKLKASFSTAIKDPEWQESVIDRDYITMDLIGDDARDFIDRWISSVAWLMYDLDMTEVNPTELDIPKL